MTNSLMSDSPSIKSAAESPKKSLRVLYADDMLELRQLMEVVLARDGHRVDSVSDGSLALEVLRRDPTAYDVVITDHHMPVVNGLALVGQLRAMGFPGKIIVFSSELSHEVDDAYRSYKVDHILPKPVFPSELRALFATL